MLAKYIAIAVLATVSSGQKRRPNILLLVTDDQDVMLGSMDVMNHTRECITANGIEFSNAFTTTPMCCPSRSSILTGLYTHNHHVYTNNDNCSSSLWQKFYESRSFATYLSQAGYRTGYFGKYLNEYNGSYTPPGWHNWMGLTKNSKYYNYTLLHNGVKESHGDSYAQDYLTDLVANRSMEFFDEAKRQDKERPVLAMVSFPAPHGPEDSAPQYQDLYKDAAAHETESFNYVPNPDKHWIVRQKSSPMDDDQMHFSSLLQQKRLQTLRSVDDSVKRIVDKLRAMQELDNTYIVYFSDHGYHIGQFGLPKGKSMPYDFDIRIPLLMRGPGLPRNAKLGKIALNIDIAPTILGMAGVPVPEEMDGRNLLDLFDTSRLTDQPWRDSFLVERGKMPKDRTQLARPRQSTKLERLQKLCSTPNYAHPCETGQFWTCVTGADDKLRLQKCKKEKSTAKQKARSSSTQRRRKLCPCAVSQSPRNGVFAATDGGNEVNVLQTCKKGYQQASYRNHRSRKNDRFSKRNLLNKHMKGIENHGMIAYNKLRKNKDKFHKRRFRRDADNKSSGDKGSNKRSSMILTSSCRLYMPNFDIRCAPDLYNDPNKWVKHMGHLARSVKTLQLKMKYMRTLRSCLNDYDERMKSRVPMCECPPQPPKQKLPKPRTEPKDNASHPLIDLHIREDKAYHEQKRVFEETREQSRMIKELRQAKLHRIAERERKGKTRANRCGEKGYTCFVLTNKTWATEPKWDRGNQCYCTNANNNTYWCVRIINENTNVLYCQFITGFREYFNMNDDPYQLVSREHALPDQERNMYQDMIGKLRSCKGAANCTLPHFTNPYSTNSVQAELPRDESSTADIMETNGAPEGEDMISLRLSGSPAESIPSSGVEKEDPADVFSSHTLDTPASPRKAKGKGLRSKAKWRARASRGEKLPVTTRQKERRKSKAKRRSFRRMTRQEYPKTSSPGMGARPRGRGILDGGRDGYATPKRKKTREQRKKGRTRSSSWM